MSTVVKVDFDWKGLEPLLKFADYALGGKVQKAVDNAVIRYSEPYVPFKTGVLAHSPYTASQIGSGEVIYDTPYARYLFYGEVYGPNIPVFDDDSGIPTRFFSRRGQKKHPTGRQLQYDTSLHPLAGPFWVERMKANHMDDILREATAVATGRR